MSHMQEKNNLLRNIPSVDLLLEDDKIKELVEVHGKDSVLDWIRKVLLEMREEILAEKIINTTQVSMENIYVRLHKKTTISSLKKLNKTINGTGVVIHTNLGRAPISSKILSDSLNTIQNYSNLEYNLETGSRGSRHDHLIDVLLRLTGAEDAVVVNNNAAAVLLILSTFAKDKEVIVSRGELVEIGGSFRIPSVMEQSGAKLVEVGTTNKTHEQDYEDSINENTALLMKIHTSNYRVVGFTKSVSLKAMKEIANKHDLPLVEDLGSGVLVDLQQYGLSYEPTVQESIKKGVDLVSFSGDKLLGGPQAGIIIGKKKFISKIKKNQLLRALRVDKVIISLLYHTLRSYLNEASLTKNIPVLGMLSLDKASIFKKAEALKAKLSYDKRSYDIQVELCKSQVGGGSLPTEFLDSFGLFIRPQNNSVNELEKKLRLSELHIITRIQNEALIIDLRTIFDEDIDILATQINTILEER